MLRSLCLAAAAALAAFASPAAAQLSPAEQAMIGAVDSERDRTVAMLGRWVEQNSGTMNFVGVRSVGEMLRSEFEPLGFKVRWEEETGADRAGHLVAYHKGRGKKLLLIAHLDTVFEKSSPFQHWEVKGDTGVGPGSSDDKGGMAVIVAALRAMKAAGTLRNADITVFMSGDEEDAGNPISISRAALVREGKRADVAIDFEPLAVDKGLDMGSTARRSSGSWTLTISGKSAHSSGIFAPGVGYGAIYELARVLDEFRRELPEQNLTYNVGLVTGGAAAELQDGGLTGEASGKTNIIAGTAIARGDLRALTQDQIDRTKAKMQAIVAHPLPGTTSVLSFDPGDYPPMAPTEGNRAILTKVNTVNRDMGLPEMGELPPSQRGAGDISFVAADVDSLAGMGASGDGSHAPGETVDIPSIFKQAKRTAILLSRLSKERSR
ncbi:M20/M25/M40 family metallo-hydrolase [Sphingomonas sp. RG327]|uniref:M20/M25/M40 family metallo-hydrolase n=1 Tax=Sphingomonas anseongensis TaxID=2908207 RepID=A0ABT0RFP5_9SPHN|nr:M20/M25/M40 family metallo-hydrolase [Sphingomonas anseongensis]MCL6679044.1 M20/M25/M40 family metallo-hydrolase [Sphingomonas anseongensis]